MFFNTISYTESIETFRLTINEFKNGWKGEHLFQKCFSGRRRYINSISSFLREPKEKTPTEINEHKTSRRRCFIVNYVDFASIDQKLYVFLKLKKESKMKQKSASLIHSFSEESARL